MVTRLMDSYGAGFSEYQYGFREGRSVEDAWHYVKSCVSGSSSKYVMGIFVDFKGAFDYLSWDSVLRRLAEVGCRELPLWSSYFSSRRACVVGPGGTVWRNVTRGCPQGSICGPYIWNLMMDTLLRRLSGSYKVCAYADDLLVLVEGRSRDVVGSLGCEAMSIVCEWGRAVGVDVAMDKTVTMLLKGRLAAGRSPIVRANGVRLRYVTEVKYLGISMSERMNFLVHIERLRRKLSGVMGGLKRILRSDWGLGRRAVRTIYEGLFVACAVYGASVWCDVVTTSFGRRNILSCQRIGLLAGLQVCRTVSTEALQVLAGAVPLDLEVMRRGILFRLKRGLPVDESGWLTVLDLADRDRRGAISLLSDILMRKWQERWTGSSKGRVTFGFVPDVAFAVTRPDFGFGWSLGFILTGHGSLNEFLHRRSLSDTADCGCGLGLEDWRHVLVTCPFYDRFRNLSAMAVSVSGDEVDVSRVLLSEQSLGMLAGFARLVFDERRRRVAAVDTRDLFDEL